MNIAIAIIVGLAMVARAQSLECFKCQDVNLVSGAQNSCTSDSIGQCSGEQVCSTFTIKFIISANGKPMDNYMKQRKCLSMTAEDKELSKCGNLESQFRELYGAQGFRNYGCEIEFCEDDLCNSDSYTKTSAWSRNSAGTAKYDNLLKALSECLERSANKCPADYPNVYNNGQHCCASNMEKVYAPQGAQCDGSVIQRDSTCCAGDKHTPCPVGNC